MMQQPLTDLERQERDLQRALANADARLRSSQEEANILRHLKQREKTIRILNKPAAERTQSQANYVAAQVAFCRAQPKQASKAAIARGVSESVPGCALESQVPLARVVGAPDAR
jgi:hypothetical protein